jgi:hypothetical protein
MNKPYSFIPKLASKGRYGSDGVKDTRLAHINPREDAILRALGGAGSINPKTGLPEYKYGGEGTTEGHGTSGTGAGTGGGKSGGDGGKGSDKEDKDLASQLDKSKGLPGSSVGGLSGGGQSPSLGRQISNLFGGPIGYQNNPNRPNYNTQTMGVPINMPWSDVLNAPINSPFDAFTSAAGMLASPIGYGMMGTRAIQAMTGMSGGPSIGGRDDGMGAFGGQGGTANGGMSGSNNINGGNGGGLLAPNSQPPQALLPSPQQVAQQEAIERKKRMWGFNSNQVAGPSAYSYQGAGFL